MTEHRDLPTVHTILPGLTYRFDAREVMDLLIAHANMSEREACDVVRKYALPKIIESLTEEGGQR